MERCRYNHIFQALIDENLECGTIFTIAYVPIVKMRAVKQGKLPEVIC